MNPLTLRAAMRLATSILAFTLSACGGGHESTSASASAAPASTGGAPVAVAATSVRIEGCVTDDAGRPAVASVRALGTDGRLVADVNSNADGLFELNAPAHSDVSLIADAIPAETLELRVGSSNVSIAGCLRRANG